ncbi:tetraspanin-10 [Xyrichtys novacula]|uniref:Tetraspanin-10 n=1 Tax=Xyrichtys novacula TaxID=13765 RepID=A0AAV1GPU1_XYRNO|nr:tetraspanin-10 [Xyrichtys novacula]
MKKYLVMKRIPMPWSKKDTTPTEASPLLPKAGSDIEDSGDLGSTAVESQQSCGQDPNKPGFAFVRPRYGYTFIDYFLKYALFLCNLLFTAMGLLVLGVGMWGLVSKESFAQEKIGSIGSDPMLITVAMGLLLALLCLTGCVGAIRENCTLLRIFSAAVLVLITAQVLAAIVAYSLQDQIGNYLQSGMTTAMMRYQDDLDLRFIMDEIQSNLQCCGADDYRDWEINIYYNCSAPGILACGVPATCCVDPLENGTVWNTQCGVGAQLLDEFTAQSVIFLGGCLGGISRWIELHMGLIGTAAIIVLGIQIMTLFITTRLLDSIYWHKLHSNMG